MINYELFRRNFDSQCLSYIITELLLLLRQLLLRRATYMVTDIVELFSVDVELSCRRDAITLSLPCSSFELIPLNSTTQRTLGFGLKVIFRITRSTFCIEAIQTRSRATCINICCFLYQILFFFVPQWHSHPSFIKMVFDTPHKTRTLAVSSYDRYRFCMLLGRDHIGVVPICPIVRLVIAFPILGT